MNKMSGAPGNWIPVRHAAAQTDPNLPNVFVTSVAGLPVPNPGGLMLMNAVGGGSGGGGGGSDNGGSTPNCGGGGGGGAGNTVYNFLFPVPPTAVTMDIIIGAGGTGGAVGSDGTPGGHTYLMFKDSSNNIIGQYSVAALGCAGAGTAGQSAASGTAVAGGNGAPPGFWLGNYTSGQPGLSGPSAAPQVSFHIGLGIIAAQGGGAGGGVNTSNAGQKGGGLQISTLIFCSASGIYPDNYQSTGSGSLGGGGAGGRPAWPYSYIAVTGGNGGVAGQNADTAGPDGYPAYGYGGGGGGGNAPGGNGAQGCLQLFYLA